VLTQKGCLILGPRLTLSSITLALPGEAASEGIIPGYIAFYIIWILAFNTGSLLGCSVHYYWGCSRAGKKVLAHYSRESWICIAWHCEVYFIFKIRFSAVLDLNLCFVMTVNVFMCALSQNRGAVPDLRIETRPWIHISRLCKKYIYCHVFSYR
jgi:hypothetical protein